jgi:hypothetical protein
MRQVMTWPRHQYDYNDAAALRRLAADTLQEFCRRYRKDRWLDDPSVLRHEFYYLLTQVPGVHEARIVIPDYRPVAGSPVSVSFALGLPNTEEPIVVLELAYEPSDQGVGDRIILLGMIPAQERWLVVLNEGPSELLPELRKLQDESWPPPLSICYCDRKTSCQIFHTQSDSR